MPTTDRKMGEKRGYWTGPEVERTQFYGLHTLFISRWPAAGEVVEMAKSDVYPHVFFAVINPLFFIYPVGNLHLQAYITDGHSYLPSLLSFIEHLLAIGKRVTVEIAADNMQLPLWALTKLREDYPDRFCALLVVEVPKLQLGGFAIKAVPPVLFKDREFEGCTMTAEFLSFVDGIANWDEYDVDVDGGDEEAALPAEERYYLSVRPPMYIEDKVAWCVHDSSIKQGDSVIAELPSCELATSFISQLARGGKVALITPNALEVQMCHADRDGDCNWKHCPQTRDGEPEKSGRHCPLDRDRTDD